MKRLWRIVFVVLLVFAMSTSMFTSLSGAKAADGDKVYVGVTFGGDTVNEAEQLIDKVKSYTNLFVVDSWTIDGAFNSSADLTEICDYAVKADLSVIVYFSFIYYNYTRSVGNFYNSSTWDIYGVSPWHVDWLNQAKVKYGDKFLGAYLYDEPGGKQIDTGYWGGSTMTTFTGTKITTFVNTTSYADAASRFNRSLSGGSMQHIIDTTIPNSVTSPVPLFTADYALYWFDYKAGYDTVFVELGNNSPSNTKIQQIALCRGAANAQQKDWGAIVTLATNTPPAPENGSTVLSDMTLAYEAGAKYVLLFDYELNGQGILTDEHFSALKQFWDNIHSSAQDSFGKSKGHIALILPTNYGWGLRHINDRMWGLWDADNKSSQIWENMNKLTDKYGLNLDIVYEDQNVSIQGLYQQTYLWNDTINFASKPTQSNQTIIFASVAGSVGVVACLSTFWVTKRRKQKPTKVLTNSVMQQSSPNQQVLLEQPLEPVEKPEFGPELNGIFDAFADIVDSLFDVLMDLHGQVDWNDIDNCLTRCKLAKAIGTKKATEGLDFRNLSASVKARKPKETAQEAKFLINQVHEKAGALGTEKTVEENQLMFGTLKSAVYAYFMVNDILLGQLLGDEQVKKEKRQLANILNGFNQKSEGNLFAGLVALLNKEGNVSIDKSRMLLRNQFNMFFSQN